MSLHRAALEERFVCSEYFESAWALSGLYDESSQLRLVLPESEIELAEQGEFLGVARPGVDGILFGYRAGRSGVWACYPGSGEFKFMSPSLAGLVEGWRNGSLFV